jgi:BirA family biotin operon repressor/biotin-[acetyl-CoA-carboxylase] ligase
VLCSAARGTESENAGFKLGTSHQRVSGYLTLAAAVSACEAVRESTELPPSIKWPNDLYIGGRKLGGILIESRQLAPRRWGWVCGIGINCLQQAGHFSPELRDTATSLELNASHAIDRLEVARALLRSLDRWLADVPHAADAAVHAAWGSFAEPLGRRVRLACPGGPGEARRECSGVTTAVDPAGGLIVQCDDGRREWFDPMLTVLL